MKKFMLEFLKRGLLAAAGGPVILAIVYGILGATGVVESLSPFEVCKGVLTVTLMAFIAAGIGVVYEFERIPLLAATLLHAATLYTDYLLIYLVNNWVPRDFSGIAVFTAIYAGGYALIWLGIYASIRKKIAKLNGMLPREDTP